MSVDVWVKPQKDNFLVLITSGEMTSSERQFSCLDLHEGSGLGL